MPAAEKIVQVYQDLADCYERQGQASVRDRFLVLAADAALSAGRTDEAERLRAHLLHVNPHHLLKPFSSMSEAAKSQDVQSYLIGLRRTYPAETAEHLLETARNKGNEKKSTVSPVPISSPPTGNQPPKNDTIDQKESPKVFRFQENVPKEESKPVPPLGAPRVEQNYSIPAATVSPPAKAKHEGNKVPPAASKEPRGYPGTYPFRVDPPLLENQNKVTQPADTQAFPGNWVCTGLFLLTLLAGIALAAYTLGRPFLPPRWFP